MRTNGMSNAWQRFYEEFQKEQRPDHIAAEAWADMSRRFAMMASELEAIRAREAPVLTRVEPMDKPPIPARALRFGRPANLSA